MPDGEQLNRISGQIDIMIDLLKTRTPPEETTRAPDGSVMLGQGSTTGVSDLDRYIQQQKKDKDKPRKVVKESAPVNITDMTPKTLDKLTDAILGKKASDPQEKKRESVVDSLLNTIGMPLLALAGGITALLSAANIDFGMFEGLTNIIGKQGLMGGLKLFLKPFARLAGGLIKKIPVIGALVSFYYAKERYDQGDYVGMALDLASGTANLMNLVMPGIGSMLSIGIDILSAYLDVKTAGSDDVNADKMDLLKEMGAAAWSKVEPYVRYIPFVGSLWLAKDAWEAFDSGDYGNAILFLLRGIANWVPLAGTAVNVGLGVVQAMLSDDHKVEGDAIQAGALDLVADYGPVIEEWIGGFIRDVPFVGSLWHAKDMLEYFDSGDYARGFFSMASMALNLIPGFGMLLAPAFSFLRGMFDPEYRTKTKTAELGGKAMDWMEGVYNTVRDWFYGFIHDMIDTIVPDVFGLQETIRDKLSDWGIKRPSNKPKPPKKTYTTKTGIKRSLLTPEMMAELNDDTLNALIDGKGADISKEELENAISERKKRQVKNISGGIDWAAPGRADGGPVSEGDTYVVGERGPEMFQPTQDGQIHSNENIVDLLKSQNNNIEHQNTILEKLSENNNIEHQNTILEKISTQQGQANNNENIVSLLETQNNNIEQQNTILEKLSENILTAINDTGTVVNNNTSLTSNTSSPGSVDSVQSFRENVRDRWFT